MFHKIVLAKQMVTKTKKTLITLTFILFLVGPVAAKVYPPSNGAQVHLGYNNSTYIDLPDSYAYFNDLNRIDNVWFINGEAYPSGDLSQEEILGLIILLSVVFMCVSLVASIYYRKKPGKNSFGF